ncbi:MAG TPA: magnesium transporter CorA family protein [Candidatus Saccharimonadales bacterium]|nr:magnesium transporter CorA family protein [Candidatus Saccharimonadales bacterium]
MGDGEIQNGKIRIQKHGDITWVDVRNPDSDTFADLGERYHLHPIHLTESVQRVQHTQVEREQDYLFLVLHYPVFQPHTDKIFAGQIGVFMGKEYLVTIHAENSPFIEELFNDSVHNPERAASRFRQGSSYILYLLISKLLQSIAGMTEIVENELDGIEGLVFGNSTSDAQRIGRVRQTIVRLRRLIGPKKILLEDLAEQVNSFTGRDMSKYYSNNVKTVNKLWEVIEEAKETIEIYKDADFTTSTERTNKTLAILTLVFTFTIPVTVVGTLYGMNVPLPGGIVVGPWMFMGRYTTLVVLLVGSTLLAYGMYVYFKRKKWF